MRTTFHPQISLEELASAVSSESVVWVRVAACERIPGPWRLRILEVVAGQSPSGWSSKRWTYPATDLISEAFSGKTVADWLREGRVLLPNRDMGSEQFSSVLQLERQQSYAQTGFQVFDWPTYEVQLTHLQSNEPPRPLISADGSPSFASFFNAASSFFGMGPQTVGGSIPSAAVFRWIDKRARINRVDIAEDELRVEVEGDLLDGLLIELAGDDPGTSQRLPSGTGVRKVTFPLQEGLPPGAWVLVRTDSEWLDRRFLSWPWARGQERGVNIELDPKTRLDAYIASRENDTVEFKRQIPSSDDAKTGTMKTVCAFSNGAGGSLLFGINDEYEVVGLPSNNANRYVDQVADLVDAWVEPTPQYTFEILPVDGTDKVIIELIVNQGAALYGSSRPNEPRKIYVRHHSRSVPARVHEIETIVRNRKASVSRLL